MVMKTTHKNTARFSSETETLTQFYPQSSPTLVLCLSLRPSESSASDASALMLCLSHHPTRILLRIMRAQPTMTGIIRTQHAPTSNAAPWRARNVLRFRETSSSRCRRRRHRHTTRIARSEVYASAHDDVARRIQYLRRDVPINRGIN